MSLTPEQCQILCAIKKGESDCHSIITETNLDEHFVRNNIKQLRDRGYIEAGDYADGLLPGKFHCGCTLTDKGHEALQNYCQGYC